MLEFSSLGAGSIVLDIITEHKDWHSMQIDTYTPTDPSQKELFRAGTFRLRPRGDHKPMVGSSVKLGLTKFFVASLRKLFEALSVPYTPGEKPRTEVALLALRAPDPDENS